jgi:hypothetical protein
MNQNVLGFSKRGSIRTLLFVVRCAYVGIKQISYCIATGFLSEFHTSD